MNILSPVNTFESAISVIDSGADEIYLGADEMLYNSFSFTGRGKRHNNIRRVNSNFAELKEIVAFAHKNGVKVNFLGNIQFFSDGEYQGKKLEAYYLDYIEAGICLGVDSLVVGDIGLLKAIRDRNYPVKIHASVYFNTMNTYQMYFLRDLGVSRVTLNYQVTKKEIEKFCKENVLDIEVIGYMGCSFYNGMCNFLHEYGEPSDDSCNAGVICKGIYRVSGQSEEKLNRIFDVETICCLCTLKELKALGVKSIKIAGREQDSKVISLVTRLYKDTLCNKKEDTPVVPAWWKRQYCKAKRCKFKECKNDEYLIGV